MSPLDDELRAALHGRAQVLAPAPDPLVGVEARARRMQRNRVGAAVAGSVLAVGMIAAVVPALQTATSSQPDAPRVGTSTGPTTAATTPPPTAPPAEPGMPANAVPWGAELLDPALDDAYLDQWLTLHGRSGEKVSGQVLFRGETNDGVQVHVYQLWSDGEPAHAVIGHSSESGAEIVRDTVLVAGTVEVDAVVPGKDYGALVIAHDPALPTVQYAPDARTFTTIEDDDARGVITGRTGPDGSSDRVRLLDGKGAVAYEGDVFVDPDAAEPPPPSALPATALDPEDPWALRGDPSLVTEGQLDALGLDWARRHGATGTPAVVPLYVQRYEVDAGLEVVYLVRAGNGPWSWGVSSLGEGGWSWYADHELADGTSALAAALPGGDGLERLLVLGAPSLGGAVYAEGDDFQPMADIEAGVFITAIAPGDTDDEYMVLDGDGDLASPVFRGPAPDFQNAG